jgi:hypothetical protein
MAPLMIQQTAMMKITGAKCGWSERTVETNGAKPPTAKIATPIPFAQVAVNLIRSFATSRCRASSFTPLTFSAPGTRRHCRSREWT